MLFELPLRPDLLASRLPRQTPVTTASAWGHLHSPVSVRHALTLAQIRGSLVAVSQPRGASAGMAVDARQGSVGDR